MTTAIHPNAQTMHCLACGRTLPRKHYRANGRACYCGATTDGQRWTGGGAPAYTLQALDQLSPTDRDAVLTHPIFRDCPAAYLYEFRAGVLTFFRRIERRVHRSRLAQTVGLVATGKVHAARAGKPACGSRARSLRFTANPVNCKKCQRLLAKG